MSLKNKTIEELLDLEEALLEKEVDATGSYFKLIEVYKMLFRKIRNDQDSEYLPSLEKIKKQLIQYLIQYGTYLKTDYRKDDNMAEHTLKSALHYARGLPIAYYRLGFLQYKKSNYQQALQYFSNAVRCQAKPYLEKYKMNDQQLYNCHLYLANCGLFIAADAQRSLEHMNLDGVNEKTLPNYTLSPLYELIDENNENLHANAYRIVSQAENRTCSVEKCAAFLELEDTIILDFTGREILLLFNGECCKLTKDHAEMLRFFLLKSGVDHPLIKNDFYDLFSKADKNGDIPTNTYIQRVRRLREKLSRIRVGSVIENARGFGETAYYFNHSYPYVIMQRSDETFLLRE